nr:histone deacetylase 14 [Tanacetum cinerariifolium]
MIVIPSIWFTKLIIHHLQRRHRFYPRPDSPLHLPNEEPVLGYLKFSAKGTKREVFGMPIPGSLITVEIHQASYYREYLAKVAQHRRYRAGKTGGVQDPPASKPTEPARKPKTTTPRAASRPSVSIPVRSAQPAPTSAPAKPHEKKGTLLPVVIREPESGKYQPLLEVPGKGKAKVTEEQSDSEEESEKVMLGVEEGGQDEGQARPDPDAQVKDQTGSDAGAQVEDQTGSDAGAQAKGQAGSNPDEPSEGQAGPDPGDAEAKVQSITSPVVHAGSDSEHMDLDVADVSPQPSMEQLVEGFTATAYPKTSPIIDLSSRPKSPKAHQQFKATTTDITTTTTTLPPPQAPQQSTTEAMMVKRIDIPQQVSIAVSEVVTDAVDWAMQAPLRNRFRDLPKADMKEILHQRMWESESYKSHKDHMQLFEALEKSMNRDHSDELMQELAEARKKKKKSRESPKMPPGSPSHQPPPPPPPAGPFGAFGGPLELLD